MCFNNSGAHVSMQILTIRLRKEKKFQLINKKPVIKTSSEAVF